jgi:hypothetical protein
LATEAGIKAITDESRQIFSLQIILFTFLLGQGLFPYLFQIFAATFNILIVKFGFGLVSSSIHQKPVANLICGNLGHQSQVQESESPPMLLSFDDKAV